MKNPTLEKQKKYYRKSHRGTKLTVYLKIIDYPYTYKDGYIMEHRYIMEQFLGRRLMSYEHIHHIDGNTINNVISNLEIVSRYEHYKKHFPNGSNPKKKIPKNILFGLRKKGLSVYKIADILNIGKSSIHRRLQEYAISF